MKTMAAILSFTLQAFDPIAMSWFREETSFVTILF